MNTRAETYFAHSGKRDDKSDWQPLVTHLAQTAARAETAGAPLGLGQAARLAGLFHDFGKYDPAFQSKRLTGGKERVDHSTAGGKLILDRAPAGMRPIADILAAAILGHHAGLPDTTGSAGSMAARLDGFTDRIAPEVRSAARIDLPPVGHEIIARMRPGDGFDLSVVGRMLFSCLVDADFRDTQAYYDSLEGRDRDRAWPALGPLRPDLRAASERAMTGFAANDLNRRRSEILAHVRAGADKTPGLFTLTVPTGGGKTLASLGFALDHAAHHGQRRIIYAIPYTSIIDQTAATFRKLFEGVGDIVLEHHSAIETEKGQEEGRDKAHLAMEDWAAPIVVTTNVQLFESLFAARPGRARKLHNIAGSVIILDEAQCLPRKLLLPALRMIETLTTHYGCTVVLCTATQPAFDSAQLKRGLPLAGRELAPDPAGLARALRRTRIVQGGAMDDAALIAALGGTDQGMVIVNSRRHALTLFQAAHAEGLGGLIHLTTRQYPAHRRRILADIRERLKAGTPCRLIATSLIEAGVDLDFPRGWRAGAGLDSVVQAAGRVNREGKRPLADSTLTVFEATDDPAKGEIAELARAMRSVAARYDDLLAPEAIRDWFEEVYWSIGPDRLGQPMIDAFILSRSGTDFPYRTTAEQFRMIETRMVPVIVATEAAADAQVQRLSFTQISSGTLARALQPFTVQIPARDRARLIANGHASFAAPELRGDQFCVLNTPSLYRAETGLWWEGAEYLGEESWML
ncbi:CRISPR-associated endonuclease Cas3'' [Paenirhodobacter enshiensis]|uniref:CRISPR-associated endonuclease Cas3'' n=1 Tax=Paenirhodobacter enshiensis TaxID=1105367 RepID=UPI003FA1FBDC